MAQKQSPKRAIKPAQQQRRRPGLESAVRPLPESEGANHRGSGKLDRAERTLDTARGLQTSERGVSRRH